MDTLDWNQLSDEFVLEGSLRDVSVANVGVADWRIGLSALTRDGFLIRGSAGETDPGVCELLEPFGANLGRMVVFEASGVRLNCHFFDEQELEFDLDPSQVTGQVQLDGLLAFMRSLAAAVARTVLLSPENMHDHPFVRVAPDGECEYISSGGFFVEMARGGRSG